MMIGDFVTMVLGFRLWDVLWIEGSFRYPDLYFYPNFSFSFINIILNLRLVL